jgi:hypothetical protein
MFALLAFIAFLLALFSVHIGTINLVTLGLVFVAAHLAWGTFGGSLPWRRS